MKQVYLHGIGVFGPGLVGWPSCRAVLSSAQAYVNEELPKLAPQRLAPAVRRRTGDYIRLAIEVASEAVDQCGIDASTLSSVFSTSDGDGQIAHNICDAVRLDQAEPPVSPTQFHNSVANAPAGYWQQAVESFEPSTSVAGFDHAFAVGMVEAVMQVTMENRPILLVSHDVRFPEPLHSARPMDSSFGVAMVLASEPMSGCIGSLDVSIQYETGIETVLKDAQLDKVRLGNPAARSLSLLKAIADGGGEVALNYPDSGLLLIKYSKMD